MSNMFEDLKKELDASKKVEQLWQNKNEECQKIINYCIKAMTEFRKIVADAKEIIEAYPNMGYDTGSSCRMIGHYWSWRHKSEKFWYFSDINSGMLNFAFPWGCDVPLGCTTVELKLDDCDRDESRPQYHIYTVASLNKIDSDISKLETEANNFSYERLLGLQHSAYSTERLCEIIINAMKAEMEKVREHTERRKAEYERSIDETKNLVYKKIL